MSSYKVKQYEIHTQAYLVTADSEAEAIATLLRGEADPVDDLEYVETCEDLGLPVREHQELTEKLRSLGISVAEGIIPSIQSIIKRE